MPLMGYLLVKPVIEAKTQDEGLLMLPDSGLITKGEVIRANRQNRFGQIVAPMQVQDEDLIYFFKNNRQKIVIKGEPHYLIEESEVAAVIN